MRLETPFYFWAWLGDVLYNAAIVFGVLLVAYLVVRLAVRHSLRAHQRWLEKTRPHLYEPRE